MKCPKCNSEKLSVVDSRGDGEAIRRRRECQDCSLRFSTYERIEYAFPLIIKKDGRREAFNGGKVRSGLFRACEKRPISVDLIEETIDNIERRILGLHEKEISSRQIGDFLMDALKKVDKIAYIRFASVYREFSDVNQFVDALEGLDEKGPTS